MAPDRKIAQERITGHKKVKETIIIVPYVNTEGSEKLEFMVVGSSWKPKASKKNTRSLLGFYYNANKKAWISSDF